MARAVFCKTTIKPFESETRVRPLAAGINFFFCVVRSTEMRDRELWSIGSGTFFSHSEDLESGLHSLSIQRLDALIYTRGKRPRFELPGERCRPAHRCELFAIGDVKNVVEGPKWGIISVIPPVDVSSFVFRLLMLC